MKPEANRQQVSTKTLMPFLEEMLQMGKQVRLTVTGDSMMPIWRNGVDSVILQKATIPKRFDVVLYTRPNGDVILHRIVRCMPEGYMIIGDNQTQVDGPIPLSQISAVVTGFYRGDTFYTASSAWYWIYSRIWTLAGPMRRFLYPATKTAAKILKHLEKAKKNNEMDS